ncbi:hypothetical protein E2C01_056673 [Portunus trituberculatus]|uniref:Uncharacterized protein n=1 Tax=Portunus trituberculatus TaxID=210409 RepID=A0A5B7GZS8_PORTR|nr:hypothetical protein [Portunus trituberculatus]
MSEVAGGLVPRGAPPGAGPPGGKTVTRAEHLPLYPFKPAFIDERFGRFMRGCLSNGRTLKSNDFLIRQYISGQSQGSGGSPGTAAAD